MQTPVASTLDKGNEFNIKADISENSTQKYFDKLTGTGQPQAKNSTSTPSYGALDFDWIFYLKSTNAKASPHAAFKHVSYFGVSW